MHRGSCLCGAVRFEVDGPFSLMIHCHCSMCRKASGGMFATFVAAPLAGFRWLAGEDQVTAYASSDQGTRSFCRHCGSTTPMLEPGMDMAIIAAGSLAGDPEIRPQQHIFCASRAAWYPLADDGLPRHDGYPPEFGGGMGLARPAPEPEDGKVRGACLCGEVAWEADGPPGLVMNCHCSRCRQARGTAHATNAFWPLDAFRWRRGEDRVAAHAVPGAKFFAQSFCRRCGSPVARPIEARGTVLVPCGALDDDPGLQPKGHIFVADKAPWFTIADGLPQWETYPAPA